MGNGKRKGKAYQPTEPQVIMRSDMERAKDNTLRTLADRNRDNGVMSLDDVFDEVVGPQDPEGFGKMVDKVLGIKPENGLSTWGQQEQRARQIAFDIIDQHELVLSLKQWQVVQNMMELAVMHGVQLQKDLPSR